MRRTSASGSPPRASTSSGSGPRRSSATRSSSAAGSCSATRSGSAGPAEPRGCPVPTGVRGSEHGPARRVTGEAAMPKFLIEANYTSTGVKGIQSAGGSSRRDAIAHMAEGAGGSMESFHFGFGESDVYVIVALPDNQPAAAVALAVNAGGGATTKTTVLLTPEEVDAAAKQSVDYRPPGS